MIPKRFRASALAAAAFLVGSAALALAQTSPPTAPGGAGASSPGPAQGGSQATPGAAPQDQGAGQPGPRRRSTTRDVRPREGAGGGGGAPRPGMQTEPEGGAAAGTGKTETGTRTGSGSEGGAAAGVDTRMRGERRMSVEGRDRVRSRGTVVERRIVRPGRSVRRSIRRGPRVVYVPRYRPRRVVCRTRWVRMRTFYGWHVRPVRVCRRR